METAFSKWLRSHRDTHYAYAIRMRLGKRSVAMLAGIGRAPKAMTHINYVALERISADSGIPIETLIADAVEAAKDPVEPRKYTKRGVENGKAQAAE